MGKKSKSRTQDMSAPPSPFAAISGDGPVNRAMGAFGREIIFGTKVAMVLFAIGAGWSLGIRYLGFKSDFAAIQHVVSAAGCDAALMIGAAGAKEGEAGYWGHLDVDQDTVACDANDPALTGHH